MVTETVQEQAFEENIVLQLVEQHFSDGSVERSQSIVGKRRRQFDFIENGASLFRALCQHGRMIVENVVEGVQVSFIVALIVETNEMEEQRFTSR